MEYTYNVRRIDSEVIIAYVYTADEILGFFFKGARGTVHLFQYENYWYEFKQAI
jgi:hypothetical protein